MPKKMYEFITGQEVEVKTIEKRIEEIWYVGKIIGISEDKTKRNKYLVKYPTSVKTPLADFIPYSRLRPKPPPPPQETKKNLQFQLKEVVDAFYNDGWWKGVVSKIPSKDCPWYTVFFKDEQKAIVFRRSDLRPHFDWNHGKWVTSQNKETEVLTQSVGSMLMPIPTDSSICGTNMDVSQTPSEKMDSPSTPNRTKVEMTAIAHIDGTFLTPIQTGSSSCSIDIDISPTPSEDTEILKEDCPSEALTSTIPCHDPWQKRQHAGLPTTQIKDPSFCNVKEIKPHGTGSMGKQIEVFKRKRGQLMGSGRKQEVAHKELTVNQMETTHLLSTPVEECMPLPPCIEKSNSPVENDNREVSSVNQLIPIAQIDVSVESPALLESSNVFDNLLLGENTNLDALIQSEGISGDERGTHSDGIAACISLVQQADKHLHDENLPFIKSSPLWGTFEGIQVLQLVPQHPHFRPLEQYNEEVREGYAIGNMVNFVKLAEDVLKAKLEEPRSGFENRLKTLAELEEHGFTVHPLRLRLVEYLRIKDSYTELDINSKIVEREFTEEKRIFDELEDSVKQLKLKLNSYMMDKEMLESGVADHQKKVAEFKEIMESLKREFDSMVAPPFVKHL